MGKVAWYNTDTCTVSAAETIAATTDSLGERELQYVTISWTAGVAPTTGENFVITLDHSAGATYDVPLYTVDPAAESATDIIWRPEGGQPIPLGKNDQVTATYANTDDLGITCIICTTRR